MLQLVQFALVLVFIACWAIALAMYIRSNQHRRADSKYVSPWSNEGLTDRGVELRRLYWRVLLIGWGAGAVLAVTFWFWPARA
jgi:hypothetical protein